ncbi:MAG TPA: hypothetical protein VIK38_06860 [Coriobacteriia bacterium]
MEAPEGVEDQRRRRQLGFAAAAALEMVEGAQDGGPGRPTGGELDKGGAMRGAGPLPGPSAAWRSPRSA